MAGRLCIDSGGEFQGVKMPEDVLFKMPRMGKEEYDRLVEEQYVCRIAFKGEMHPYIAPFLYVFDGRFMYFLSTNYGKKVQ